MTPLSRGIRVPDGIGAHDAADQSIGRAGSPPHVVARSLGWPSMYATDDKPGDVGGIDPNINLNHTGTTIVAVTADDATVLGADRRASLGGQFISNKDIEKIHQVHPTAALALSGAVSDLQQLTDFLQAEASLYEMRRGEPMSLIALSSLLSNLMRGAPMLATPILGGIDEEGPRVFTLDPGGGRMEDRYTAAGSGMQLAYGVLEREYEVGLTPTEASSLVARSIDTANERDTASGNGLSLATVTAEGTDIESHPTAGEVG